MSPSLIAMLPPLAAPRLPSIPISCAPNSGFQRRCGMLGLAALLIYRAWRHPLGAMTAWWAPILAGVIYGFSYFCIFLEGQTVILGLPFAASVVVLALIWGRKKLAQQHWPKGILPSICGSFNHGLSGGRL